MKTKEKVIKHLDAACNAMDEKDMFVGVYMSGNNLTIAITGDNDTLQSAKIAAKIAAIIHRYYTGEAEVGEARLAKILITAIKVIVGVGKESGTKLVQDITKASIAGMLKDFTETIGDDEPDGCEDCEINRTCNEKAAVAYRKANGIPKPKKGGRKSDKK